MQTRALALDNDCPTGTGDLSAASWCYEIHQPAGAGRTIEITFHPIIKNVGDKDWYSNKDGTYYASAYFGSRSDNINNPLPGFPNWHIELGRSKQLEGVALPFHEDNQYTFGWNFVHTDDENASNDSMRLHSLGEGTRFSPGGNLEHMQCDNELGESWAEVTPPMVSLASPALAEFEDAVFLAAVRDNGAVVVTSTNSPGNWSNWQPLGGVAGEPNTAPILLVDAGQLNLFVRGIGNNLFRSQKPFGQPWSAWQPITINGEVRGRVSIVATSEPVPEFHTMFPGESIDGVPMVIYRRYNQAMDTVMLEEIHGDYVEGVLGTDGTSELIQVLRAPSGISVYLKTPPWVNQQDVTPNAIATHNPNALPSVDISNIESFGNAFHFGYTSERWPEDFAADNRGQMLQHIRIRATAPASSSTTVVASTNQSSDSIRSAIENYRNKLVFAYNDPDGTIRYARLDNADPAMPWISTDLVNADHATIQRVALTAADFRPTGPNYDAADYGNDLFAAMSNAVLSNRLAFANFSRLILTAEGVFQFKIYDSQSQRNCCQQDGQYGGVPCNAPIFQPSIGQDGRPFISELGFLLWVWPHWFSDTIYRDAAVKGCEAEHPSGRFDQPCTTARYPIITMPAPLPGAVRRAHLCGGAWIYRDSPMPDDLLHETLHATLGSILGFWDDGPPPSAAYEALSGIPVSALRKGFDIFSEDLNADCLPDDITGAQGPTCSANKAPGFVDLGGINYDQTTRQHSFIGALTFYIQDGNTLRNFVNQDVANGNDLLQRKYDWIRQHIFRGMEFTNDYAPL